MLGHYRNSNAKIRLFHVCNKDLMLCKSCDSFLKLGLNRFGTYFSNSIFSMSHNKKYDFNQKCYLLFPISFLGKTKFFQEILVLKYGI